MKFFLVLVPLLIAGCNAPVKLPIQNAPINLVKPLFEEVSASAGIHFSHTSGANPANPLFPETTPGGCAFFDYDNDGFVDILLIQSGSLLSVGGSPRPYCALYHNNGDGTFTDVTVGSGLDKDLGFAHGIAIGDYDNDGFEDIFICGYDHNFLFHNEKATGKFIDVTSAMGLDKKHSTGYATSAAFGDYDNDGKLDLYVCYYGPWSPATDKKCNDSLGRRDYCSPEVYPLDTHVLYHNEGHKFVDVSSKSGIDKVKGRGLAVAFLDYDEDGKQDIFVANDLSGNMLWHNEGGGKFVERGSEVGCRYGNGGSLMAGMGIAVGDYDQTGHESLFVTNFQDMPNMLFKNLGNGTMEDKTVVSRVGPLHLPFLSFGCEFIDYDADGWLDILTANGHVQLKGGTMEMMKQAKQLLHNEHNGTYSEISDVGQLGSLKTPEVARGLAVGDFDNDGRLDALFNNQNGPAQLFRNMDKSLNHWISFKTVGTKSNRDGYHAKIWITIRGKRRVASVRAGSSYLSVSDKRVYFGLGKNEKIDKIEIFWPSGIKDTLIGTLSDTCYIVTEGRGITGKVPVGKRRGGA